MTRLSVISFFLLFTFRGSTSAFGRPVQTAAALQTEGVAVSARAAKGSQQEEYSPPLFRKTAQEDKFIMETLRTNFMFQDLPSDMMESLVKAFEKVEYPTGSVIVNQGDADADFMYILSKGECSVAIDGKILPEPYGTMTRASIFGELALLYDAPRAATIKTKSSATLFRLDKDSFMFFLVNKRSESPENLKAEIQKIDKAIDKISGVTSRYGGTIIREYRPERGWLWRRWKGTVVQHAWKPTLGTMLMSFFFILFIRTKVAHTWPLGTAPDHNITAIARLEVFGKLWRYLMTLTTFILTFFLSQAYSMWRDVYNAARKIQGRMNDIGLLLATAAERKNDGSYTTRSAEVLDDVAVFSRLFHVLLWAKFSRAFEVLLSAQGMSRMLSRGLLTREQFSLLQSLDPKVGAHNACLEWLIIRALRGTRNGSLDDCMSLRKVFLDKACELRGTAAGIGDILDGRMPLAYVHFVQVLVDAFLVAAPFALYAELGILSILSVGILTLFYSGLLDLAKILLDPLDNEDFYKESVNMDIGVLIRESNAGSTRWKAATEKLPFR